MKKLSSVDPVAIANQVIAYRDRMLKEGVPPIEVAQLTSSFQTSLVMAILMSPGDEGWKP